MITSYVGRSRMTEAWFGVILQQAGENMDAVKVAPT